jgi:hypothetical protein
MSVREREIERVSEWSEEEEEWSCQFAPIAGEMLPWVNTPSWGCAPPLSHDS